MQNTLSKHQKLDLIRMSQLFLDILGRTTMHRCEHLGSSISYSVEDMQRLRKLASMMHQMVATKASGSISRKFMMWVITQDSGLRKSVDSET